MRPSPPQYGQALTEINVKYDFDLFFKVTKVKIEVELAENAYN